MQALSTTNFEVRDIENAGRGLIAKQKISALTPLLNCKEPIAHVLFREYRKEVCGQCFHYDRGRTLDVRAHDIGKVFCSDDCYKTWLVRAGDVGVKAWQKLEDFIRANSKSLTKVPDSDSLNTRPTLEQTQKRWAEAGAKSADQLLSPDLKPIKQRPGGVKAESFMVEPDVLGFLLQAIITHNQHPDIWRDELLVLAMDKAPYTTMHELEAHCTSFSQLQHIVPREMIASCLAEICQTIASAASHNAFGIRSGGDDNEEYMGYGVWTTASFFNHSCWPNVQKKRVGREWQFSAAADIEPGEQLCISYLGGDERGMHVDERQLRLQHTWGFPCGCHRCEIETEEQRTSKQASA